MGYEIAEIVSSLKMTRAEKGISQRELSELSGIPQAQISKLENGQADVRMSTLVAVSRALGLEIELVPRKNVPAVQAILRRNQAAESTNLSHHPSGVGTSPYSLTEDDDE